MAQVQQQVNNDKDNDHIYDNDYSSDEEYDDEMVDLEEQYCPSSTGGSKSTTGSSFKQNNNSTPNRKNSQSTPTKPSSPTKDIASTSNTTTTTESFSDNESDIFGGHRKQKEEKESNHLSASEVQEILDKETECTKKKRLPSSEEVYNRIKWEAPAYGIDVDTFIIGYVDRFVDLMKVPFSSFEIGVIPLHRVMKIYYQDKIIWDRKERLFEFPTFDN